MTKIEFENETSPTAAVSDDARTCCREYERASMLTRRRFMTGVAAAGGMAVSTAMFGDVFRQVAFGAGHQKNVLVVVSLRGGIDGLSVAVPYKENNYYASRPTINIPEGALINKDHKFGMHPEFAPLQKFWDEKSFAIVHATGLKVANRSHFSAMEEVEDADPGSSIRQGWVNRAIGLNERSFPMEATQFGTTIVPTALSGPSPTIASNDMQSIYIAAANPEWDSREWRRRRTNQLHTIWDHEKSPLGKAARSAFRTVDQMAPYAHQEYKPRHGVTYPTDGVEVDFANAMKNTAQLIRARVGTEVVAVDYGNWDLHVNLGGIGSAQMDMVPLLQGFVRVMRAFLDDLSDMKEHVTVVTISEFGRRVDENSSAGLDHGWGNVMMLFGAGVKGGQYYARWPGLSPHDLGEGDLKVTTDYRNVLAEVVHDRLGHSTAKSFPGLKYKPLGIIG